MRPVARVLVDEAHRQAWTIRPDVAARICPVDPTDASYALAATALRAAGMAVDAHIAGPITRDLLAQIDVLVLPHCSDDAWERTTAVGSPVYSAAEIDAIEEFVSAGGGLIVLAETEQLKYGNNLSDITQRFGITIENSTVQDPSNAIREVATWIETDVMPCDEDIAAAVHSVGFYRTGHLSGTGHVIARTSSAASPAGVALAMASTAGRVIVLADSDLVGDDCIDQLSNRRFWTNLVFWAAGGSRHSAPVVRESAVLSHPAWTSLVTSIEALRPGLAETGALDTTVMSPAHARPLSAAIALAIQDLMPLFEHQRDHLEQTIVDLQAWVDAGFPVPDFLDSLKLFRPDLHRQDGCENLAVFPMYTQNGNTSRHLEAVVTRTFWPEWLAEQESQFYRNPAFVPIEFVGFTAGYDTHSAVFFPETVATRELAQFHWGGIFCDREAARFRRVTAEAADVLQVRLPSDAARLVGDQRLAQEAFVLWDLIHDRTHSHGDLPFDPFMIKQRMPYWMYALEELRCDLTTYRETLELDGRGVHLGRFVRYAILFDRLFRFPITGERTRNYDGLGGQILFGWLHRDGVVRWRDNAFSIDWHRIDDAVVALCGEVENLYREGIDRPRVGHWIAAYEFVRGFVEPHPGSTWAKGIDALPVTSEPKAWVDLVLPDEFPLNVFYDALRRKLAPVVASTAGIAA